MQIDLEITYFSFLGCASLCSDLLGNRSQHHAGCGVFVIGITEYDIWSKIYRQEIIIHHIQYYVGKLIWRMLSPLYPTDLTYSRDCITAGRGER